MIIIHNNVLALCEKKVYCPDSIPEPFPHKSRVIPVRRIAFRPFPEKLCVSRSMETLHRLCEVSTARCILSLPTV